MNKDPERRYLTPTQIIEAVNKSIMSSVSARTYLIMLGFSQDDIKILFLVNDIDARQLPLPLEPER